MQSGSIYTNDKQRKFLKRHAKVISESLNLSEEKATKLMIKAKTKALEINGWKTLDDIIHFTPDQQKIGYRLVCDLILMELIVEGIYKPEMENTLK